MTFSSAQKRTIIRSADRVSRSEISVSAVVVFRTALWVYWTLVPAWLTQDVTSLLQKNLPVQWRNGNFISVFWDEELFLHLLDGIDVTGLNVLVFCD